MVAISKHTLTSLRILDHDRHPSLMGIGVRKGGFSVLTLLDRCVTSKVLQNCRILLQQQVVSDADPVHSFAQFFMQFERFV